MFLFTFFLNMLFLIAKCVKIACYFLFYIVKTLFLTIYFGVDSFITGIYNAWASLSKEAKALTLITLGTISVTIWSLLPNSDVIFSPFVFSDVKINPRTYVWMLLTILCSVIFMRAYYIMATKYYWAFNLFIILFAIDIFDYLMFYGEPVTKIFNIPIEYTLIKGISMVTACSIIIFREIYLAKNE